jgi:hypothetical protein
MNSIKKTISGLMLGLVMLTSCKKAADAVNQAVTIDYDKVTTSEVRLVVDLPASVSATKATDKYYVAGSFKAPNDWKEKGIYVLTPIAGGTFKGKLEIRLPLDAFENDLDFKIQRNGEWKTVEKDNACAELANNRKAARASAGKVIEVKVDNFRNTGTCPD